jgi:hypothetical protein
MKRGAYLTSQIHHQSRVENMYNNNNNLKNKDFGNHKYNCILNSITLLFLELINYEQNQSKTKITEVILECKLTDILQKLLDVCNSHFENFKLRLEME